MTNSFGSPVFTDLEMRWSLVNIPNSHIYAFNPNQDLWVDENCILNPSFPSSRIFVDCDDESITYRFKRVKFQASTSSATRVLRDQYAAFGLALFDAAIDHYNQLYFPVTENVVIDVDATETNGWAVGIQELALRFPGREGVSIDVNAYGHESIAFYKSWLSGTNDDDSLNFIAESNRTQFNGTWRHGAWDSQIDLNGGDDVLDIEADIVSEDTDIDLGPGEDYLGLY